MNNTLSHEQAIQFLHEAVQYLSANQQADLAGHLAMCDRCRAYAAQLATLQPQLSQALRTRSYVRQSKSTDALQTILQLRRRKTMRKQAIAVVGIVVVAAVAIVAVFSTRIPSQSMTGAQLIATAMPTMTPSPTSTALPTATPLPSPLSTTSPFQSPLFPGGADRFEPNDDFAHATPIELDVKYDQLNFAMLKPNADGWDSDYFKVRVKPDMLVTCRTSDLSAGTDTNLILYDQNRNGIAGNDNIDPAKNDLSSSVGYVTTYEGWLYVLVGEGFPRPPAGAQQATYSLECSTSK